MSAPSAEMHVAGFFDASGARTIVRRLKIRCALQDAKNSIEALLNSLDERAQADCNATAARIDRALSLLPSDFGSGDRRVSIEGVDSKDVREKELLDGVNLVLEFLDTIGVGIRHGLFSCASDEEANRPASSAHRLCGGAK